MVESGQNDRVTSGKHSKKRATRTRAVKASQSLMMRSRQQLPDRGGSLDHIEIRGQIVRLQTAFKRPPTRAMTALVEREPASRAAADSLDLEVGAKGDVDHEAEAHSADG